MAVMPREVNQSQISVPSRSMANALWPPPGNTTIATPVFFFVGEYTVSVGLETLHTQSNGAPLCVALLVAYSGFIAGWAAASGGVPGQMGICTCPGDGCQTFVCALKQRHAKRAQVKNSIFTVISGAEFNAKTRRGKSAKGI
jgi:hypothetical protein